MDYHAGRHIAQWPCPLRLIATILATVAIVLFLAGSASRTRPVEGASGVWTQVSTTAGDEVQSLALSGSTVLGGTYYNGLYRIQGGSTTQPLSSPVASITTDPANPSSLIGGSWYEGIFVNSDSGQTWTSDSTGLAAVDVYSVAFLASERFAGTSAGVFYRAAGGWEGRSSGLPTGNVLALLAVAPNMYAGTSHGVYTSADAGLTWQSASSGLGDTFVYSLVATSSRIVAGTQRGVYYSGDGGLTWTPAVGIGATAVRALAASTKMANTLFAGTVDGPFRSADGGANWLPSSNGLPGEAREVLSLAFAGTTPEMIYAGTSAGIWKADASAAPVGGIAEWSSTDSGGALGQAETSGANVRALAGVAAAAFLVLMAGVWHVKRRET